MTPSDLHLHRIVAGVPRLVALAAAGERDATAGHGNTLREICHQPATWRRTAEQLATDWPAILERWSTATLAASKPVTTLLTGSGSSYYVGACLAPALQAATGCTVRAVASGDLLTHADAWLIRDEPGLVVSFGRSGDSPESFAVAERIATLPQIAHLIVTCNRVGRLATRLPNDPRVASVVLDERTNDRSLVMTSSFTNMLLAGWLVLCGRAIAQARSVVAIVADAGERIIQEFAVRLEQFVPAGLERAVLLGTAESHGAAREASLKIVEMTGGRTIALPESFLGLRHGPMAALDAETLVVCLLSSDAGRRAYERDLIAELDRKGLGGRRILVGESVEPGLARSSDLVVDWAGQRPVPNELACLLHVLVGQWLGFWGALAQGCAPDRPSVDDVITRVVPPFTVYPSSRHHG